MTTATDTTFLDRHPRTRQVLTRAARRGANRVAQVDDSPAARRAAISSLPSILRRRFKPESATKLDKVYELRIRASAGGPETHFALTVRNGTLDVVQRDAPDAHAWLSVSLADMIRLTASDSDLKWTMLAAKRLDMGGDPFVALRFPGLFGL